MTERPTPEEDTGPTDDGACFRFANAEFDERRGELRVAGKPVTLEPRVRRLLGELLRHTNEVLTKDELFDSVWDGRPTVDHALASAVSKLRSALGAEGAARIATVPRVGYRLDGPVQRVASAAPHLVLQAGQAVPGRPGYVLERPLGSGGHADVWLGRHAKLGHARVYKFASDGSRLSALRREFTLNRLLAQTLGAGKGFAAVVDAQFHSEPFFLECEYGGRNLQAWAAEPDAPLAALPLDERLALFSTLVHAVAEAHGVGVLHKDLKPGNVLIERRPTPPDLGPGARPGHADASPAPRAGDWQIRLTDFGSGRLLDRGVLQGLNLTALGLSQTWDATDHSISGTLMYLAPEVLAGQAASVRSDVYALGVMLYQWVVADLARPMATGWERDVADPLLRADIAAATDGDPAARLASATELAQRLDTLAQRRAAAAQAADLDALQARQAQQLARARARRPWVTTALVGLSLGLLVAGWQMRQADAARQRSEAALKASQATLAFLTDDVLTTPDLGRSGGDKPKPLLALAREGARRAGQRFAGQPLLEAQARAHLARTFKKLWATHDAVVQYDQAQVLLQPLLLPDDERRLTLQLEHALTEFDMGTGAHAKAQQRVAAALQAAGVNRLAQATPLAVLAAQAQTASLLAQGRDSAAVVQARALVSLADRLPSQPLAERIAARRTLAHALMVNDDMPGAERVLAELDQPPFAAHPDSRFAVAHVHWMRAGLLSDQRRFDEAKRLLLAAQQRVDGAPQPSGWHIGYARVELAHLHQRSGHHAAAAEQYQAALDVFRSTLGDGHAFVLNTAFNLGRMLVALGRTQEALALCRDSAAWALEQRPDGHIAGHDRLCGEAWLAAGEPARALQHLDKLPTPSRNDEEIGLGSQAWETQALKGLALEQTGHAAEGVALLTEAKQMLAQFDLLPTGLRFLDARLKQLN